MNDKELRKLHEFITDLWQLLKQYWDVKKDQTYWDEMLDLASQIMMKHKDVPLAHDYVIRFLERQQDEARRKGYMK